MHAPRVSVALGGRLPGAGACPPQQVPACHTQVPIIKLRLAGSGLHCDLSICNPLSTLKAKVTRLLLGADERVLGLYHLVSGCTRRSMGPP